MLRTRAPKRFAEALTGFTNGPTSVMPRASQPHTPDLDLAARRQFAAEGATATVLTPDLKTFCQSGVSVIVAAGGPGEMPVAGVGSGCRVLSSGNMRLLLHRSGNEGLLATAERGGLVSATFSQPLTHRSIQVKGRLAAIAPPSAGDGDEAARQMTGLHRELVAIGDKPAFCEAYCHVRADDLVSVEITLEAAFVQTPGPGAGAELKP